MKHGSEPLVHSIRSGAGRLYRDVLDARKARDFERYHEALVTLKDHLTSVIDSANTKARMDKIRPKNRKDAWTEDDIDLAALRFIEFVKNQPANWPVHGEDDLQKALIQATTRPRLRRPGLKDRTKAKNIVKPGLLRILEDEAHADLHRDASRALEFVV